MGAAAKIAKALRGTPKPKPTGEALIADWQWRPAPEVQAEIGLGEVPSYITNTYGEFMNEQAGKAAANSLTPRDLIKAYGITRSSVNRGARAVDDDLVSGAAVRPEGYFSEWLLSPAGQEYLRDATKGGANQEAIADLVERFNTFGMAPTLGKDLTWAARELPQRAGNLQQAVIGGPSQWREFAQQLRGIGPSKSGFIASLLGRGDMPTLDARQLVLHTGRPATEAKGFLARRRGRGGDAGVDRLAARQADMNLELPASMRPHYQHLTHHAVWDKTAGTKTTHDDLVRAMQRGAATPGAMAATGGLAAAIAQYLRQPEE